MRTSRGKRKKYDLDRVVHSESETTDRKGQGWRRSGRSVVSVRSTGPREVKVEISEARVVEALLRHHLAAGFDKRLQEKWPDRT